MNTEKYLNTETDYLESFYDEEMLNIFNRTPYNNLDKKTEEIMAAAGVFDSATVEQVKNFRGWVYMLNNTRERDIEKEMEKASNILKETIKQNIGGKMKLEIVSDNFLGGESNKISVFRIIKDADERIFLMPPKAKRRGYLLSSVTIVKIYKDGDPC